MGGTPLPGQRGTKQRQGPEGRKRPAALSAAGSSLTVSPAPVRRKHRQKKCATGGKVSAHALGNSATNMHRNGASMSATSGRMPRPFGVTRQRHGAQRGGKAPARAAARPRARRRARRGPGHGQHGALLHARGCARGRRGQPFKSLFFPKKRKIVPLQVQFLYTNVHKLGGT